MSLIGYKILEWVLPVVLGPLVYYVAREVLNVSQRVDDLPPVAKRVAVVFLGTVCVAVFNAFKLTAPEACVALTDIASGTPLIADAAAQCAAGLAAKVPVQGITAALVAMVIHAIKKQKPYA